MITEITIHAPYCFGTEPLKISNLGAANFLFAPNGSGKTTISTALSHQPDTEKERRAWPIAPTPIPIRVFNEDYRRSVLTEHVGGIFTLGEESEDKRAEIERLTAEVRRAETDKANAQDDVGSDSATNMSGAKGKIHKNNEELKEHLFQKSKEIDSETRRLIFKGFTNSKSKFHDESVRRFSKNPKAPHNVDWSKLKDRVTVLSTEQSTRPSLTAPSIRAIIDDQEVSTLSRPLDQMAVSSLSTLIEEKSSQDWVNQGRKFLTEADSSCPFCQQRLPDDFRAAINDLFAHGFDQALKEYDAIRKGAEGRFSKLHSELDTISRLVLDDSLIDGREIISAIDTVRTAAQLNIERIRQKASSPTQTIIIENCEKEIAALRSLLDPINLEIELHNELMSARFRELNRIKEEGWALFLNQPFISSELKKVAGLNRSQQKKIDECSAVIYEAEIIIKESRQRISAIRATLTNTAHVSDRINSLLGSMGFARFSLAPSSAIEGGYMIVRNDGSTAVSTLSEGERSFVCFAYFWESLFGSSDATEVPGDVIAVIDDPISSLDSDVLFVVASQIRQAAEMAINSSGNVKQLLVLTHNTQFHREASYYQRNNDGDRTFYRLIKPYDGGATRIIRDGNLSRIRGSYSNLWDAVVEAAKSNNESTVTEVGIFNIVRRIQEGYFRLLGGVHVVGTSNANSHEENGILKIFEIWANAGSHTIADDVDQVNHVGSTKNFLRLFHKYFILAGHESHFNMMITASGGDELLKEGEIFAPRSAIRS